MGKNRVIYLDNAATSWPKPESVYKAVDYFMRQIGANPGRSGHSKSVEAARIVFETREAVGRFFGVSDSDHVIFTANATHAINLALKGVLKEGDHVIVSSMEHNSVMRPLRFLQETVGITIAVVECDQKGIFPLQSLEEKAQKNTRLIAITHASNVTGTLMPIQDIGKISRKHNALFLVDAAQTGGVVPLDMASDNIDLLVFTGHKSLMGPQGIGGLCVGESVEMMPLMQGGTGSNSEFEVHPDFLPDRLESGTLNTVGIAGLGEGIRFIEETGLAGIREHEKALTRQLLEGLSSVGGIKIYGPSDPDHQISVVSFNIQGAKPCDVGYSLDREFGIMARVGLHCAPAAHKTIGTFPEGTVRFSLSYFNTEDDITTAVQALREIALRYQGG